MCAAVEHRAEQYRGVAGKGCGRRSRTFIDSGHYTEHPSLLGGTALRLGNQLLGPGIVHLCFMLSTTGGVGVPAGM